MGSQLGAIQFSITGTANTSWGYSIYRESDGTWFDFATTGATAQTFTASPTTVVSPTALAQISVGGVALSRWKAPAFSTTNILAQFPDGAYTYDLWDTSGASPVPSDYSGPVSVWVSGGNDQYGPATVSLTTTDKQDIANDVVSGINTNGVTVGGYAAGKDPGSYVLASPADKLATDSSGYVTATNGGGGSFPAKAPDGWITGAAFAAGALPANFAALAITTSGQVSGTFTLDAHITAAWEGDLEVNADGSWTYFDPGTTTPRMKYAPRAGLGGRDVTRY